MGEQMRGGAIISSDGRYRWQLWRNWADRSWGARYATFVMLNPSTADAEVDDPTVRRCIGFARSWGLTGIYVVNLYALRSTEPQALWSADDPVGPENDAHLRSAFASAYVCETPLIAAWGAHAKPERAEQVLALADPRQWRVLGLTKGGQPRHPLYLRRDVTPQAWRWSP